MHSTQREEGRQAIICSIESEFPLPIGDEVDIIPHLEKKEEKRSIDYTRGKDVQIMRVLADHIEIEEPSGNSWVGDKHGW